MDNNIENDFFSEYGISISGEEEFVAREWVDSLLKSASHGIDAARRQAMICRGADPEEDSLLDLWERTNG